MDLVIVPGEAVQRIEEAGAEVAVCLAPPECRFAAALSRLWRTGQ